jgi:hypothetical protein
MECGSPYFLVTDAGSPCGSQQGGSLESPSMMCAGGAITAFFVDLDPLGPTGQCINVDGGVPTGDYVTQPVTLCCYD